MCCIYNENAGYGYLDWLQKDGIQDDAWMEGTGNVFSIGCVIFIHAVPRFFHDTVKHTLFYTCKKLPGGGILGVVPVRKWKQRAFPAFNRSSLYKRKGGGMGRRFEAAALSKIYSGYRIKERLKND